MKVMLVNSSPKQDGCTATALGIDRDYGLIVRYGDGREETVRSGEVSVRGLYGYIE